jgi:hypothetical protein
MSVSERNLRSAINRLLSQQGVVHGTLIERERVCGKPNCRCTRGYRHKSLYLVVSEGGKLRQLYVPADWQATVREWIENYQAARRLMDGLSSLHWEKVRKRQG